MENRSEKSKLTHVDHAGKAALVDVSGKQETRRRAEAFGRVAVSDKVFAAIRNNQVAKGDVLTTAKIAAIQGSKKTWELIPLCHNIFISKVDAQLTLNAEQQSVDIHTSAVSYGPTGVEMEALTAASVAALTVYDMCKALDKSMVISDIKLLKKSGGKSGDFVRPQD